MKQNKRKTFIIAAACIILIAAAGWLTWSLLLSPTRIAFVNYQAITLGQIAKANNNSFIKITDLSTDDLDKASGYDMILVNGMGLRITDEQRTELAEAAANGTPVLTAGATNPQNLIISTDSVDTEFIKQYLSNGNRGNYRSMLNYIRKFIDGKDAFTDTPSDPVMAATSTLYHPDPDDPDGEHLLFNSVKTYTDFLAKRHIGNDNTPSIILTGMMGVPDPLISTFEKKGFRVYPVSNLLTFIRDGHADSITPSAIVNMAHGRLGDVAVDYLNRTNIPLFSPVNVNRPYQEWMDDKMGISGGFMSQSIVTPEIDGAIRPFSLFAHFEGSDGLPYVEAIPDRLDEFVETVGNYITLRDMPDKDKRVAIFYFKGPGQNSLVAEGMEVAPSLYNLLLRLRDEGYDLGHLPSTYKEFERLLNERGKVFGHYATGEQQNFVRSMDPELISKEDYVRWCEKALGKDLTGQINAVDGAFPGHGLSDGEGRSAIARLRFGNIVLIPQTAAGLGDDDFKMVHGTDAAPPHAYVASYLWARYGFGADALIHFGAHGSLEYTPRKQAALASNDWSDRLVGTLPHIYIYSTSNVGEAMIAKRRSYAGIINYLTPPFMESGVRATYKNLSDAINAYNKEAYADTPDNNAVNHAAMLVKRYTLELGIHRELRLDSIASSPYTSDEIARIENFAEELANEKITGANYTMGVPYSPRHIHSTVEAMTIDPIAYSLLALDKLRGNAANDLTPGSGLFTTRYLTPARRLVERLMDSAPGGISDDEICRIAGISSSELSNAREIDARMNGSKDMLSRMMILGSMMPASPVTARLSERSGSQSRMKQMMKSAGMSPEKALEMARKMGADEEAINKMKAAMKKNAPGSSHAPKATHPGMQSRPSIPQADIDKAIAIMEIERAVRNVINYREALAESPEKEMASVINALAGGYTSPTSGGDPVLNPQVLPTGRNMFAINAEETPSAVAWEKGKALAENTIKMYRKAHGDSIPRKVSYTLWSSEFIETEGATIAQILYMLGVEPVRDPFNRVTDLRLIPSDELGRPRIDVVVQTSGQLRDLAASRLFLISRAVKMAAGATGDTYPNYVAEGVVESERHLVDKGVNPKEARSLSTARVFGGVNGNYGSGIQSMVEAGDKWNNENEIAETYINNMGAMYGSEEEWEQMRDYAFEAAITRTDAVVQPRQSNTWGALSLDHVYEFMGGMNLAVRSVTGKDPEAYLSDYRNRNNVKMQEVKEAIGIESRTTILNPNYITEKMKGGAGDASAIADVIRNTYGWNVMKPDAIDDALWDNIYETYVTDRNNLGTKEYFSNVNPAALEEITAVMLETARKGMWDASDEQISTLADLHTDMIEKHRPSCSGFVCDNAALREYIASNVSRSKASGYNKAIGEIRAEKVDADGGTVMKKETIDEMDSQSAVINGVIVAAIVIAVIVGFVIFARRRRAKTAV